jgi:hypothetical protein
MFRKFWQSLASNTAKPTTIAYMLLATGGNHYSLSFNFNSITNHELAEFMFYDGCYACDCILSDLLHAQYPEVEVMKCGSEIEIEQFTLEDRL